MKTKPAIVLGYLGITLCLPDEPKHEDPSAMGRGNSGLLLSEKRKETLQLLVCGVTDDLDMP